jgi:hypothetical protein
MVFWGKIALLYEMQMKQENILCGQNLDVLNFIAKPG